MRANSFKVYWAEIDSGQKLEWPRGMRAVSLGDHDRLQADLWKYGKHLTSCRRTTDMTDWCTCGWDKVRETLAPPKESPEPQFDVDAGRGKP